MNAANKLVFRRHRGPSAHQNR